jgi:hypothetical protein
VLSRERLFRRAGLVQRLLQKLNTPKSIQRRRVIMQKLNIPLPMS